MPTGHLQVAAAGPRPALPATRVPLAAQRFWLAGWLLVTDALAIALAFRLAYWVRFELELTLAPEVPVQPGVYGWMALLFLPLWLGTLAVFGLYDARAKQGGIVESARTFNACAVATLLVVVATFLFPPLIISRVWVIAAWLGSFLLVAVNRFLARRLVYWLRRRGLLLSPALIVGANEEGASLNAFLGDGPSSGVRVVGLVKSRADVPESADGIPVVGDLGDVPALVRAHGIEDLIVAITAVSREELLKLYEEIEPLPVQMRISSGLYELLTTRVTVRHLGTLPLMSVQKNRLEPVEVLAKTLLEIPLTLVGLALLSPLLAAIAIWVKLDSRGPVLYRRRVLGVAGRQFDAFKFRTMHVNGDALLAKTAGAVETLKANHKLKDDPRITRAGRVLRRFSLDELPQLFNVLLGQMALVGPRMITPDEAPMYGRQRINLLTLKPGITGLWQVSGRSDLSYDERVRIDMYYVRNYSIWIDLQILFVETLPAVLRGKGAY